MTLERRKFRHGTIDNRERERDRSIHVFHSGTSLLQGDYVGFNTGNGEKLSYS